MHFQESVQCCHFHGRHSESCHNSLLHLNLPDKLHSPSSSVHLLKPLCMNPFYTYSLSFSCLTPLSFLLSRSVLTLLSGFSNDKFHILVGINMRPFAQNYYHCLLLQLLQNLHWCIAKIGIDRSCTVVNIRYKHNVCWIYPGGWGCAFAFSPECYMSLDVQSNPGVD